MEEVSGIITSDRGMESMTDGPKKLSASKPRSRTRIWGKKDATPERDADTAPIQPTVAETVGRALAAHAAGGVEPGDLQLAATQPGVFAADEKREVIPPLPLRSVGERDLTSKASREPGAFSCVRYRPRAEPVGGLPVKTANWSSKARL